MVNGLVLFDYDGTLVDERDAIFTPTSKTKEAIIKLQERGFLCVLATGRALCYIPQGAKDLALDGYVASNGAYVCIHDEVIFNDVFADDEVWELIQYMEEHDINYILESTEFCYVKDLYEESYLHFISNFKVPTEDFVKYERYEEVKGRIEKVTLAFKSRSNLENAKQKLQDRYECSVHRNCNTFDIRKRHIHKGVGTKAIIDFYQVPLKQTFAFGDGDNDVELLDTVFYGIAMGKHDPKLDAVAYMITDSVKNEGIYEALKKLEVL